MDKIRFMVVSGFLGAGKTTTMIALAEYMDRNIGKTAIIANDLGANLVDTSLTQTSGCTVAEIGNDCICYQMDNTVDQIRRLRDKEGATFVMSDIPGCGVGALDHVYHTLHDDNADEFTLSPFMVMPEHADINLPEELVYLLKLQLEEADLIVLNKIDLLDEPTIERYMGFLHEACPDIPAMKISAKDKTGIPELAEYLTTHETALKNFSVALDRGLVEQIDLVEHDERRLDRGHPHGAYRTQAERAAPEDLRDLRQWRLQQGVAHRRGLRHRIRPRIPARPQEHAHDHQCPRRLRVAPACSPHGRRARRGVRQVRP